MIFHVVEGSCKMAGNWIIIEHAIPLAIFQVIGTRKRLALSGITNDYYWLLVCICIGIYYIDVVLTAIEKGKNGTTHHRRSIRRRADHCPGAREGRIHGVEYDPRAWNRHLDELGPGAWPADGLA